MAAVESTARVRSSDRDLLPALAGRFHPEVFRFGERLASSETTALTATDRRTNLGAALQAVRDRYRGRPVAGIVLLSDGGDNGEVDAAVEAGAGPPVYAIGVGPRSVLRDREVVSTTATESVLTDSLVDVGVSAVSHGYGKASIRSASARERRAWSTRVVSLPPQTAFRSAKRSMSRPVGTRRPSTPCEIPAAADEVVAENNGRSVLVPPPARARRVLLVEGAPGFEHSFLKRAWSGDRGLEIDSVVRKGRDDSGANTFYVQAAGRAPRP